LISFFWSGFPPAPPPLLFLMFVFNSLSAEGPGLTPPLNQGTLPGASPPVKLFPFPSPDLRFLPPFCELWPPSPGFNTFFFLFFLKFFVRRLLFQCSLAPPQQIPFLAFPSHLHLCQFDCSLPFFVRMTLSPYALCPLLLFQMDYFLTECRLQFFLPAPPTCQGASPPPLFFFTLIFQYLFSLPPVTY